MKRGLRLKMLSLTKTSQVTTAISIIVVNEYFPSENFDKLISSTAKISSKFEVILVTHSLQKTSEAKQHLTKLLEQSANLLRITVVLTDPNKDQGPAYRRNIGASLADSENLLFADDDAMIAQDVAPLLRYLVEEGFAGVQPIILKLLNHQIIDSAGDFITKDKSGFYSAFSRGAGLTYESISQGLSEEQTPSLRSAFMLLKKDAFLSVGGFDPTFDFNLEDVDLGWRLTLGRIQTFVYSKS